MVLVTEIEISAYKKARPLHPETLPATAGFIENLTGGNQF
jgi:hypothetical protein